MVGVSGNTALRLSAPWHPQGEVYRQALQRLVPAHAAYPPGFVSWEQCVEEDEEEFYRFRCVDQSVDHATLPIPHARFHVSIASIQMCVFLLASHPHEIAQGTTAPSLPPPQVGAPAGRPRVLLHGAAL